MDEIEAMRERVATAGGLPELLDVGWDALSLVLSLCWQCEARAGELFPAFMLAGVAAAEARMALVSAPSMPAGRDEHASGMVPVRGEVEAIADAVAALAHTLEERLAEAGGAAQDIGDRQACEEAAAATARVAQLLSRARA